MKLNSTIPTFSLYTYRFEALLAALLFMLFGRIFFPDSEEMSKFLWSLNLTLITASSVALFKGTKRNVVIAKNMMILISLVLAVFMTYVSQMKLIINLSFLVYFFFLLTIFVQLLRQIFALGETNLSVILGSISGYLLLIIISKFSFMLLEFNFPESFSGLSHSSLPALSNQLTYYSVISLATVGYGDISPITENARLLTMFFVLVAQFYMVALVGIIVSRFTPVKKS
jgi:hypothetical protein